MKLTNKKMLEHKKDRFNVYTFGEDGYREMCYGNYNIIESMDIVKRHTLRGLDVLIMDYSDNEEVKSIKVVTELEKNLKRRASKEEIIKFLKPNCGGIK